MKKQISILFFLLVSTVALYADFHSTSMMLEQQQQPSNQVYVVQQSVTTTVNSMPFTAHSSDKSVISYGAMTTSSAATNVTSSHFSTAQPALVVRVDNNLNPIGAVRSRQLARLAEDDESEALMHRTPPTQYEWLLDPIGDLQYWEWLLLFILFLGPLAKKSRKRITTD